MKKQLLLEFLIYLNNEGMINNHDFEYEKAIKKFLKTKKEKRHDA